MRWQQRVRVATGLSCWQVMLHILLIALLVVGWLTGRLVNVGIGLCVLYAFTLLVMFALRQAVSGWCRECRDFLEELTTTWYFGIALIALWLIGRVVYNPVALSAVGVLLLLGPTVVSLLTQDRRTSGEFTSKHRMRH